MNGDQIEFVNFIDHELTLIENKEIDYIKRINGNNLFVNEHKQKVYSDLNDWRIYIDDVVFEFE